MSDPKPKPKIIVVAGDVTIDWNIARREDYQGSGLVWNPEDYIRTYSKPGGAALLAELIDAVAEKMEGKRSLRKFEVKGIEPLQKVSPDDERYHHSYAIWSLYKYDENSPEHKDVRVWRVKNSLGFHPSSNIKEATTERWARVEKYIRQAVLIVLDDATILLDKENVGSRQEKESGGFRQQSGIWGRGLTFSAKQPKPWIIIKMARPVAKGELWKHLIANQLSNRLIVVIPVNELRFKNAQISRELSWERTAQDLVWELINNADLAELSRCAHVIVSFGTGGALWLKGINAKEGANKKSGNPDCTLFFDPRVIEEMWGQNHPGDVVGYTSCLVASLAHQVMRSQNKPDIHQGIQNGLRAIRKLRKEGYGKQETEKAKVPELTFPVDVIAGELTGPRQTETDGSESREPHAKKKATKDGASLFSVSDLKHAGALIGKLREAATPLPQYLKRQFSPGLQQGLEEYNSSDSPPESLQKTLVDELNQLIQGRLLYNKKRFAPVQLSRETKRWLDLDLKGAERTRLNRLLLEDAYSQEIAKSPKAETEFSDVPVKDPTSALIGQSSKNGTTEKRRFWMIIQDGNQDLYPLAKEIVIHGAKQALKDVPLGEFGDLLTADRHEIESYRSVSALIREYCEQEHPARPLSIAVFGPPGSGKSFGISKVAKAVYKEITKLTFNLSQFSNPKELLGALHQVRDKTLAGGIPLVFWDEFDTTLNTQPLGWLRYFLAPMQDGEFQDGQITHPIGRAIFVFAGGTSTSKREFEHKIKSKELKDVKGLDFISRLKGFIDIMGPNRVEQADEDDLSYIIRRALLLRSLLEGKTPNLFRWSDKKGELRIDDGVLRAFLMISRYRHGARSMEAIIEMSRLAKKNKFERSALPPATQLDLHVDGREFLAIVQQTMLFEELAKEVHRYYCENLNKDEPQEKSETNEQSNPPSSSLSFEELPPDEQEQNRNQARHIEKKLAAIGCVMIQARSNEPLFEFSHQEIELMAEMEHERWMKEKLKNNWSYARKTDKGKRKKHEDILLWQKLSEDELRKKFSEDELKKKIGKRLLSEKAKKKDRDAVSAIPQLLAKIGYTIARAQDENKKDEPGKQGPRLVINIGVTDTP